MIIPFSIIILSFLIPESLGLRVTSGFFALVGTTFSIARGLVTETLGHAYNFGFFMVTHIATLETKRKTFLLEFERVSSQLCKDMESKKDFMLKHLTNEVFVIYEQKLHTLSTLESVKIYAEEICLGLNKKFLTLNAKTPFHLTDHVSGKTIVISVVVIVVLFYAFMKFTDPADVAPDVVREGVRPIATDNVAQAAVGLSNAENMHGILQNVVKPVTDSVITLSAKMVENEQCQKTMVTTLNDLTINNNLLIETVTHISSVMLKHFPTEGKLINELFMPIE